MGVGGGLVAREPGGERILAGQGQPFVLGSPCRRPGSGWEPSLASAGVLGCFLLRCPTSGSHAFWQAAARRYELYPHFRAEASPKRLWKLFAAYTTRSPLSDL